MENVSSQLHKMSAYVRFMLLFFIKAALKLFLLLLMIVNQLLFGGLRLLQLRRESVCDRKSGQHIRQRLERQHES